MAESSHPAADIRPGRLGGAADYAAAFADSAPRLTRTQALVESERCLYCYDAPCATACPTGIDVPSFIRRIAEDNLRGAARTILESNPLGGTCSHSSSVGQTRAQVPPSGFDSRMVRAAPRRLSSAMRRMKRGTSMPVGQAVAQGAS